MNGKAKNDHPEKEEQHDQDPDFLREFIEKKKLQNRILQEMIDKLNRTENKNNP